MLPIKTLAEVINRYKAILPQWPEVRFLKSLVACKNGTAILYLHKMFDDGCPALESGVLGFCTPRSVTSSRHLNQF